MISHTGILIVFLFLIPTFVAYGQHKDRDHIVTLKGDTVYGRLSKPLFGKPKLTAGEEKYKCDAEEIRSYHDADNNKTFRSVQVPNYNKNQWVRVLEDGLISLYEFVVTRQMGSFNGTGTTSSNTYWYAYKEGVGLVEIKTNSIWGSRKDRKDNVSALFADNETITNEFKAADSFTFDRLQEFIQRYNQQARKPQ